jgi:hypothetical protein
MGDLLERLEDERQAAINAYRKYEADTGRQIKAIQEARKADAYVLDSARRKAIDAVDAERDRLALLKAAEKPPFPEGARLVRKVNKYRYRWDRAAEAHDAFGIFQIYRIDDPLPKNSSSWNRPKVGDYIVREVLKDGSPAKRWEPFDSGRPWKLADSVELNKESGHG